jgi:hypothetical protein
MVESVEHHASPLIQDISDEFRLPFDVFDLRPLGVSGEQITPGDRFSRAEGDLDAVCGEEFAEIADNNGGRRRVDYSLTPAGVELQATVHGICKWTRTHLPEVIAAREHFAEFRTTES